MANPPSHHTYEVVAMEIPIVYTVDGDHDPNGMLFTLKAYEPLLTWVRERWEDEDGYLPLMHHRRQRIQLIVDALPRLEQMLHRLRGGTREEQALLGELIGREHLREDDARELNADRSARRESPHMMAVRQNVDATMLELQASLAELNAGDMLLVTADAATREQWLTHWRAQLAITDRAIAGWFERFESDPARALTPGRLTQWKNETGIPRVRIKRLLLNDHSIDVTGLGERTPNYDRFNPMRPVPVVRPLVLRAHHEQRVTIEVHNQLRGRRLGFHAQGEGMHGEGGRGVRHGDGAHAGNNPDTTIPYGDTKRFFYDAPHEGVWLINDLADLRGSERGTNAHGLFAAIVVEQPGVKWRDPETGDDLTFKPYGDGPNVDIIAPRERVNDPRHAKFVDFHLDNVRRSFREFTVFIHDEPEIHSGLHAGGEHTVMPLSYRAEPMPNRLPHRMRRYAELTPADPQPGQVGVDHSAVAIELGAELDEHFWVARTPDGRFLERVAGEEQHHSSWLFGDPVTPILRAYRGDPARVRLVHAGVKETHIFHLHVHQWRAVPHDTAEPSVWRAGEPRGSQLLDSVTIGPQTGVTIDPLYGSGSRQHAVGDVIWHCHLYPHFHHGMWGLWRSYDRLVDGHRAYPDGTPCPALRPLPGRDPEPSTPQQPGFPWFMDASFPQKSPPPPAIHDDHVGGRRRLLQMPKHSAKEFAAFDDGCKSDPHSGALFVDLDGLARKWNADAGLPPPRIVTYDVQVGADHVEYNEFGWHDPLGHHYTLLGVQVAETDAAGAVVATTTHTPQLPHAPEPFFPRANHGDIVELRFHNALNTFPADQYDLGQLPVECGLHVHLVKFDVLTADGSSTGWNYLSGASCGDAVGPDAPGSASRRLGFHRWVVDEEFGPCFFHDHLLANYRQKHGLFAALIAEPHGSQWHTVDQDHTAWASPEAVVVPPPSSGLPPYREACLAVGDFVPLLNRDGQPLNPPHELSGDDDPGSMAVNFRSAPLTHRGDDPSQWFASRGVAEFDIAAAAAEAPPAPDELPPPVSQRPGDPRTPVIRTYPGERLRLRLIQGSHEEQHSFSMHGMRWPREWHNDRSTLVNQQTLGISEAFTLDIDPAGRSPYGPGDHLWQFAAMDDLWLGCWGLVRVLPAVGSSFAELPPLPDLGGDPAAALARIQHARAVPPRPHRLANGEWSSPVREFVVAARRIEHRYDGDQLTDPWGLIYEVAGDTVHETIGGRRTGNKRARGMRRTGEPLVLRARRGEWVKVTLVNEVLTPEAEADSRVLPFGVEPSPPRLPLETLDELGRPVGRTVSPRVSMHPSLLLYDMVAHDGAYVGSNHDGTVAAIDVGPRGHGHLELGDVVWRDDHGGHNDVNWREYWWYADEALAPASHTDGPGQVCYLQDMADVRNHRHHGLVGALVVEPGDVTPYVRGREQWSGASAELRTGEAAVSAVAQERVMIVQDGLRLFLAGNPDLPVTDVVPLDDPEDSGQKGLSYRGAPGRAERGLAGVKAGPTFECRRGDTVWLRVVGGCDKPRNHTLNLHGMAWEFAPWVDEGPMVGSVSGVTAGWVDNVVLTAAHEGDHSLRSGVFRWGTEQGMCALLRVR